MEDKNVTGPTRSVGYAEVRSSVQPYKKQTKDKNVWTMVREGVMIYRNGLEWPVSNQNRFKKISKLTSWSTETDGDGLEYTQGKVG